jgi:quercetin dioxygenase-like cupin family protein
MKAKTRIPDHHNPGRICIQTIFGHIRMRTLEKVFDLPQGKMLVLDRAITHDVEAVEESAFLLTVAHPDNNDR